MISATKFVFVGNGIDHRIEAIHVGPHPHRFLFNPGINFWNRLDLRIHRLRRLIDLVQKIGEGLNPELHPLAESGIGKVSQLYIMIRIQPGLVLEGCYREIVEAGP